MKKAIVLFSLFGLMSASLVLGQTATNTDAAVRAVQQEENITTQDLGVSNPGLLPTNPFYFFKELGRNVQRVFTFNPVAKAELEVKIANEKAAEAKKIQETVPNNDKAIAKGIENYQAAQQQVQAVFKVLNISSTTPAVGKLLDSVANGVVLHQKVLDEIAAKASDSADIKNAVDSAKNAINAAATVIASDTPAVFAQKLQAVLDASKGSDLKHVRSLEIITNLQQQVPEAAKAALLKVQENIANKLDQSVQQAIQASGSAVVNQILKALPSADEAQRADIVNKIQVQIKNPDVKSALSVYSCDLIKQSMEKLTAEIKAGNITEEQYNLKYAALKKELESCMYKTQPAPSVPAQVKQEPVSQCDVAKSSLVQLELMLKDGTVSENDYNLKKETLQKILNNCTENQAAETQKTSLAVPTVSSASVNASAASAVVEKDCGKADEKVNRDPLAGPVDKPCCYGLKENRVEKTYSICAKPEINAIDGSSATTAAPAVSGSQATVPAAGSVSASLANPASVYCAKKGYKSVIRTNIDGSQYGVCIFSDGKECDEWKFYNGQCSPAASTSAAPITAPAPAPAANIYSPYNY